MRRDTRRGATTTWPGRPRSSGSARPWPNFDAAETGRRSGFRSDARQTANKPLARLTPPGACRVVNPPLAVSTAVEPYRDDHDNQPEPRRRLRHRATVSAQLEMTIGMPPLPRRRDHGTDEGERQGDTRPRT